LKTILVVDDDKMILRLAVEALKSYGEGYQIRTALNGKQAVQILNTLGADLVLTDLKMPVMDGYELLSYMSERHQKIPVIVMTGFGSPDIAKRLKQKGVLHYIEKPFEISILREKVADLFSKGHIHGFTLANVLQAAEVEQKTTTLRILSKEKVGFIYLQDGELIDAEAGNLKGEPAAIEILCWDDAKIDIIDVQKRERSIYSSLMQILLEASRKKDDKEESLQTGCDILEEAVQMAEGHHFKESQRLITEFFKDDDNNRRNPIGWLWYSRIIVTLKSIETSLNNAVRFSPDDPEIAEDIKKLNLAKENITTDNVRRCPFCWSPVALKAVQCLYCRSHLLIHSRFFKSQRNADPDILNKAIERYTKVIGREKNINAHYYLSMAHLNLDHWEEALNLLHKTVNLDPDKKIFSEQLRVLLNYMASRESTCDNLPIPNSLTEPETDVKIEISPKKKRILVVEDSPTTRKVIAITLGQKGYEIIEASDGLEALSMLNEGKPDLILLDIILPKMDGYKILEIIKKNTDFKNIPVIMLTSRDGMLSKLKGRFAGSTAYLTKPFEPSNLVETIEKYI